MKTSTYFSKKIIKALRRFTSNELCRPALGEIAVNGNLLCATDTHLLAWAGNGDASKLTSVHTAKLNESLNEVIPNLQKKYQDTAPIMPGSLTPDSTTGTFPNVGRVTDGLGESDPVSDFVWLNADLLQNIVKAAKILENNGIGFRLMRRDGRLNCPHEFIVGDSEGADYICGIIMPMAPGKDVFYTPNSECEPAIIAA